MFNFWRYSSILGREEVTFKLIIENVEMRNLKRKAYIFSSVYILHIIYTIYISSSHFDELNCNKP